MIEPKLFSPEAEEVLRDVARDPNSTLLRFPRRSRVRSLFELTDYSLPLRSNLTYAERELLDVHREEVAAGLRERATNEMFFSERYERWSCRFGMDNVVAERCPDRNFERDLQHIEGRWAAAAREHLENPHRCSQMLRISDRIVSGPWTRLLQGLALAFEGWKRTGSTVIESTIDQLPRSARSFGWEYLAWTQGQLGDSRAAAGYYHLSIKTGSNLPAPRLGAFFHALNSGDSSAAVRYGQRLDSEISVETESLKGFVRSYSRQRKTGEWAPTPAGRRLSKEIVSTLGCSSREIACIFE